MTRRDFLQTSSAAGIFASLSFSAGATNDWTLWYRQAARRWLDALPVGNGRLGAMVFGGIGQETLALNEATMWSGSENLSNINPSTSEYLGKMRQLLFDGEYAEANALCAKHLCGREDSYGTHLPLAKLRLDTVGFKDNEVSDYQRSLNLETGIARVEFSQEGTLFVRETFASNPDNILVTRITASQPGKLSLTVSLDPGDLPGEVHCPGEGSLILSSSAWEKSTAMDGLE